MAAQKRRLFVILGAGASYDCAGSGALRRMEARPPLVKDLFFTAYSDILHHYPMAEAAGADIRLSTASGAIALEKFLRDTHVTLMAISLRRDPGVPILQWLRGGPSVQIEIEAGPKAVSLNADEDGLYLRAVGPSIEDASHRVVYTVSLSSVTPWIP